MMASRAYRENYALIDWSKDLTPAPKLRGPVSRSDLPAPMIVTDSMEPLEHPCDGQRYTSKAKFRETTRAHGCIEIGNEKQKPFVRKKSSKADNLAAVKRARSLVNLTN